MKERRMTVYKGRGAFKEAPPQILLQADGWNGQDLTQGIKLQWTASRGGLSSQRTNRKRILERGNRQILIFYEEFLRKLIPSGKIL